MFWSSLLLAILFVIFTSVTKIILTLRHIDKTLSKHFLVPEQPFIGSYFKFNTQERLLKNAFEFTKKYGSAFKINIFMCISGLIISDVKWLEYILGTSSIMHKGHSYTFLRKWLGDGLLLSAGDKWKVSRKIITPAFHFQILEEYVKNFRSSSEILIKKLSRELGQDSFDVYPYIVLCTLDIICEAAMGTKVNAQENSSSEYVRAVKDVCEIACNRGFSIWKIFEFPYRFSLDFWKEKRCLNILHSYTRSVIEKRKADLSKNKDGDTNIFKKRATLLDLLLKSQINGRPLTYEEIQEEVDTFMFAGHDTTASAISFTLFCLSKEQVVQQRAVEELNTILGIDKSRPLEFGDFQNMKYLERVIKETLRLYPPVPFYFRETDQDIVHKDAMLPAKSQIAIFAYGVHRDESNFPDPEKFDPDRFLLENQTQRSAYSYVPFSAGPRNCIGQKFAMFEMKYIVSEVLRNYEIHSATDYDLNLIPVPVLRAKNGLYIKLKQRY